jgi:hypothetical protein
VIEEGNSVLMGNNISTKSILDSLMLFAVVEFVVKGPIVFKHRSYEKFRTFVVVTLRTAAFLIDSLKALIRKHRDVVGWNRMFKCSKIESYEKNRTD